MTKTTLNLTDVVEITDDQWSQVREILPPPKTLGRHRLTNLRSVVSAILTREATGCTWTDLNQVESFPPRDTVYGYWRDWNQSGLLWRMRRIVKHCLPEAESTQQEVSA